MSSFTEQQKEEIKALVGEALGEYFSQYGTTTRSILIGTATVIGALTVILGGLKSLLGWLGFTYLIK